MTVEYRRGTRPQGAARVQQKHPDYSASRPDKFEQWIQWAESRGVRQASLIVNKWVRTNAPQKSIRNTSLGIMLKDDCIHIKDFITGNCLTFFDNSSHSIAELHTKKDELRRLRKRDKNLQESEYNKVAHEAARLWHVAQSAPLAGYFSDKRLSSTHGARWHQQLNCWLILVTDVEGTIYTVQRIFNKPPPNKFYLKGGRIKGGMVVLGSLIPASHVIVCEGFATGCTLREATGEPVVCALSCFNLMDVCTAVRAAYPIIKITVAGDDDGNKEHNVGRQKAIEAAKAVWGTYEFPYFCSECAGCSDFNDVSQCESRRAS